jgi:hypothetical protein
MQGHGDDRLDAGPEVVLPADALDHKIRQNPGEDFISVILIKQNEVLDDPLVPAPGPVTSEGRPRGQAVRAKMGLTGAVEKKTAADAGRGIRPLEFGEALPADDLFAGSLEKRLTDLAGGGEKEEFPQLSPRGKPSGETGR